MSTADSPGSNPRSTLRLRVRGDLDMWSAPQLDHMVEALRSGSDTDVLLDLSEVAFMDSMGLRALVQLHDVAASRGGVVTVVGETQTVRKVLRVSGVNALLGVPDSDDEPSADVDLSLLQADPSAT